jgi:hypothetical protein
MLTVSAGRMIPVYITPCPDKGNGSATFCPPFSRKAFRSPGVHWCQARSGEPIHWSAGIPAGMLSRYAVGFLSFAVWRLMLPV